MRHWGIVITAFYAVVLILLSYFGVAWLAGYSPVLLGPEWVVILALIGGQALLLFLSVDSSFRLLRPRKHILVTASLVGFLLAGLVFAAISAFVVTPSVDDIFFPALEKILPGDSLFPPSIIVGLMLWVFWGILFYRYSRHSANVIDSAVSWVIRGSVLELLVAVPCHIIVRHKDECTSPLVSAYGVATGMAIMLLAFGPSIMFLFQRKLQEYEERAKKRS